MSFQATNPQYRNGCTLIQGDSLLVLPYLPAGIVDAVVTDPPYGIGYKDGSGRSVLPVRRILNNLVHPTEKPVDLMQDLICSVCPQDGLVVDPFMGSGPTGLAALNSSRRFLGIEITDEHYATAKRRLELHSVECVSWPSVKVDLGRSEAF